MTKLKNLQSGFLLSSLIVQASAGMYYDLASCNKYLSLLDQGVLAVFEMGHLAQTAIGAPVQNDPNGNIWGFPDTESRDLTGKIFGPPAEKFQDSPINYQYTAVPADPIALANSGFEPPATNGPNANLLTAAGVVKF
ncbi:uncharacterized protein EAE98_000686 [Botrytis deweyae]|uniref:Uncharacterized protein n=1 Tax=Botrytis deweyae TaxID=2478750 RepID=A0ABQ7J3F0_9HELO|nr:uncharacterized protein EAE98_000686 [Botrytis deweyae]KAF7940559.1 hypothetical protein EAE98_000686 [Botrytis deweyae]